MILPATGYEVKQYYKNSFDILLLSGDAYIDHPAFGTSLIARLLSSKGFNVAIASQPTKNDLLAFPRPDLFIGISAGNVDSIISNYTANRKIRSSDKYSSFGNPNRHNGKKIRPDRATLIYTNWVKEIFKGIPVIIGGVEASLRRIVHYDYYSDKIRKSILADSKADLLVFGMGEKQIIEISERIAKDGCDFDRTGIKGTCYISSAPLGIEIPGYEDIIKSKDAFLKAFSMFINEHYPHYGKIISQKQDSRYVICNPPADALSTEEMDIIYSLPFTRAVHRKFKEVPAFAMIANSITSHRGCAGSCSFCSIQLHQGKIITSRSSSSILLELDKIINNKSFHGHITDVGGPSADMYGSYCKFDQKYGCGPARECLYPDRCPGFITDHERYYGLLEKILLHQKVKKVSIGSGLRLDLSLKNDKNLINVLDNYSSGILKVAPEHIGSDVLEIMKKYKPDEFAEFVKRFKKIKKEFNFRVELVPYFITSHPGETEKDINTLAHYLSKNNIYSNNVQDFTPSPMTRSTVIYYSGINPENSKLIPVIKKEKQRKKRKNIIITKIS